MGGCIALSICIIPDLLGSVYSTLPQPVVLPILMDKAFTAALPLQNVITSITATTVE